jgi:hypothetical protein
LQALWPSSDHIIVQKAYFDEIGHFWLGQNQFEYFWNTDGRYYGFSCFSVLDAPFLADMG